MTNKTEDGYDDRSEAFEESPDMIALDQLVRRVLLSKATPEEKAEPREGCQL